MFCFQDTCTLVSYAPKKTKFVILLSTMHNKDEICPETGKPIIDLDYNSMKGGVDTVDQKYANYSTARKTRRWPLAIFFRLLDMAGVNSHVIYVYNNINNPTKKKQQMEFLEELAFSLLEDHLKNRARIKNLPLDVKAFLTKYLPEPEVSHDATDRKTGPCHECGKHRNNKTSVRCSQCTRFVCKSFLQNY